MQKISRRAILCLSASFACISLFGQQTVFEQSGGTESATYFEAIDFYQKLARESPRISIDSFGQTDAGYPLHVVWISRQGKFNPAKWHAEGKLIIFILNGIHPGEPDGIDASMMLVRDIAQRHFPLPDNVGLAIIPIYNVGGSLNRNSVTRVNQNGPVAYGFRGNAENLDLNRDFIKGDSKNARSFTAIFHMLDPDVFIDTHVSDGADYQHTMTLISTQYDKLGPTLGSYLKGKFEPAIFDGMRKKQWDLVPYVNVENEDPSDGFSQFYDSPRYSSGYAALFNTLSFMPETHMLKPYKQRVQSTLDLLKTFIEVAGGQGEQLTAVRKKASAEMLTQKKFPLSWKLDTANYRLFPFKGYEAELRESQLTHSQVLYFHHEKPYTKTVKFFDHYVPGNFVTTPKAYLIPAGWWKVTELLKANGVKSVPLESDSTILVKWYALDSVKSYPMPYESHHKNYAVQVREMTDSVHFLKGDLMIYTDQPGRRFLVETLEPEGDDGYFTWNFFDAVLQQKEYFSPYRWDTIAYNYYKKDPVIREKFDSLGRRDASFVKNPAKQLDFIYRQSPHMEKAFMRYPVYRIEE